MSYERLKAALKQGNVDQFKKLISNVEEEGLLTSDENGNTLVHLAVIYDQPEILKKLIDAAKEFNSQVLKIPNNNGFTPLECSYVYSSSKTRPLLESDPQLSPSSKLVIHQKYKEIEALSPGSFRKEGLGKIIMVASALDAKALSILLGIARNREDLLRYKMKDGWSGVHFAAYNNNLDAIQLFSEQFAIEVTDNQDNTPLMTAAGRGNLKIIEYLLAKGGNLHQKNKHGENTIFIAAENGQLATLKFLDKEGVDLLAINDNDENALMAAARNGYLDCVHYLLDRGVPANLQNKQGKTAFQLALDAKKFDVAALFVTQSTAKEKEQALFDAVRRGDLATVQWLAEHGASLTATDESKMIPMLLAASSGNIKLIDYFLSQDPPPIHDKDSEGDNPLFVAIKNRQTSLVIHLVASGFFSLEDKNAQGKTPLLAAAEVNSDVLVEFFHQKGYSLEARDDEGNTAFHLLLAKGNLGNAMEYLHANSPALILEKNNKDETPLHTAVRLKRTDGIEELLRLFSAHPQIKTKLLEARDDQGNTALLSAIQYQNSEAVPLLLAEKTDVLAKNHKGQTVINIAHLNIFSQATLKALFDAYQIDYREYYHRRRLYFIFGGSQLHEVLKFQNAEVKLGFGLFDEGVSVLNSYLNAFIKEKHPEYSSQFTGLLFALNKLESDTTVENILSRLDREGMAFQATGFTGHSVLATLKNMADGSMKLSLAERGGRIGDAPFLNAENKKFVATRSIIVPADKRQRVIELLFQAKKEPQATGIDILFKQIPEFVGEPYQFSNIYQKKFLDICFYSNPKTGLYEQFIEILGEEGGKTFYKEFELYMREQELKKYKEFRQHNHPDENLQENPIIVKAQELIEKRQEALQVSPKLG
ncbi:Ankyrin repeat protein [Legionella steigerwaltii]|uniref:Ankyrin repeat protein n=1 Tax=Legionella steigerwaltii TaxID=460 RepID=A0A378L9U1_9GAMM|nr:ankyrin repeat domain-containing protein [Legionella steigerwaltii]KTD79015.1 Ankyrin repeat protein [Legionella steigerwaltii]STY23606.1 Ankyrin repeat protein [Legionella steigerwaltii]